MQLVFNILSFSVSGHFLQGMYPDIVEVLVLVAQPALRSLHCFAAKTVTLVVSILHSPGCAEDGVTVDPNEELLVWGTSGCVGKHYCT